MNKVLSNVTLDEKRACVPAEPERLAIDVAIIHFRRADVPFNDELSYPLAPPEYSVFVGKKLKELDVKRIIPVMCSIHKVEESIVEEAQAFVHELFDRSIGYNKARIHGGDIYRCHFVSIRHRNFILGERCCCCSAAHSIFIHFHRWTRALRR